jgi:hypothetical protein
MRERILATSDLLLCALVVAVACAIYLSGLGGSFALNSDMVMPYVVYADAVAGDHALSGWLLPESPYWFPDLLLTFAIHSVVPLLVAVNLFAFVQVAAYLLLARWVLRLVLPQGGRLAWHVFVLLWLATVLIGLPVHDSWFDRFGQYLFVPSTHAGSLLSTLASLGLLLRLQRAPRDRVPLAALLALAIATVLSDRLYAITCLLPLLGVALLPILHRTVRVRVGLAAVLVLAGSEAWRWIADTADTTSRYGPVNTPAGAATQMAKDLFTALTSGFGGTAIVLAGCIALGVELARAWRRRERLRADAGDNASAVAAVFIALALVLPFAASIALGRHTAMDSFRYCQTVAFLLLPLAWRLGRAGAGARETRFAWGVAGGAALAAVLSMFHYDTSETALRTEWRAQADCIDRAHAQYGLHHGLSRYWHANSLTAQLASRAPIFSISGQLESIPINKNIDWIGARAERAAQIPSIDFVDEFQFDAAILDKAFGLPHARIECPLSPIRVYGPDAGVLGALYRENAWLPQDTLRRHGRMAAPAAAWVQSPARVEGDGMRAHGAFALHTPLLLGALELDRPVARAWLDYRLVAAPTADVRWEAVALDAQGGALEVLASGVLGPATMNTHHAFELPAPRADAHGIGFSVAAKGQIDLVIRAVGMATD